MGCLKESEGERREMKTGVVWMVVRQEPSVSRESRLRGQNEVTECQAERIGFIF